MKVWTLADLKDKAEFEADLHEHCILMNKSRSDEDGNDISIGDNDIVWVLVGIDGEYRLRDHEPDDMVAALNYMECLKTSSSKP